MRFATINAITSIGILMITGLTCVVSGQARLKLAPPEKGIYHCAFPDFGEAEDSVSSEQVVYFSNLTGKNIIWAYFSNNWLQKKIEFPLHNVNEIHKAGVIPFIRACPRSDWKDPMRSFSNAGYYSLQKISEGKFDKELRAWAKAAASVQFPLCVEFGPEMNGNWFYWDGLHNNKQTDKDKKERNEFPGPSHYVAAYKHFVDICRAEGAHNITWFLHFDANGIEEPWNAKQYYYPGDEYVDWIGISCYGSTLPDETPRPLREVLSQKIYQEIVALSPSKPIALLEFGCPQTLRLDIQPFWLAEAFNDITEQKLWPNIKAISWWHSNFRAEKYMVKLRVDASTKSLEKYRASIAHPLFIAKPTFIESSH